MNSVKQPEDKSRDSEDNMLQRNGPMKSEELNETILLPSGNERLPSSNNVEDWRELAQRIQQETDSSKIVNLVQQLLAKFDEQDARPRRADTK